MNNKYALIMAGGVGSRFWPLSQSKKPKQFLDIIGNGETLLQQTFRRFKSVCPQENIFVVTNADHKNIVIEQLGIESKNVLSEPLRKNTAPCIAYGTYIILKDNPCAIITVTPADHLIENEEEFRKTIITGFDFVRTNEALITLGIKPDKPETGYGYIQADIKDHIQDFDKLFKVKAFTEKPDLKTAKSFIKRGGYYWNAGIFIWSAESIIKAMKQFLPDIWSAFDEGKSLLGTIKEEDFIFNRYSKFQNISIDYGVLEKADNVYVLETNMNWSDLGTWGSLYDHSKIDVNGNAIIRGKAFSHDCRGNLISVTNGKVTLLQGLKDYIVVDTSEALLIIRREDEQNIKLYLEEMKSELNDI